MKYIYIYIYVCVVCMCAFRFERFSFLAPEDQSGEDELSANSSVTQIVEIQRFSSIFVGSRHESSYEYK